MLEHKEQAIRERAYAIWEEEKRPDGKHLEHWRRTEDEINSAGEVSEDQNAVSASSQSPGSQYNLTARDAR